MKKIVVLISGSGSNLQAIIDKCNTNYINAEVICVISNNPNAFGIERAKSVDIKTIVINHKEFQSRELFDAELYKILLEQNADLIVLAGFMRILTEKITNNFFGKICIYCHSQQKPDLLKYDAISTVVVPGKPLESRLYYMVYTNRMPKGGRLSDQKKWAIYHWILNGAQDN